MGLYLRMHQARPRMLRRDAAGWVWVVGSGREAGSGSCGCGVRALGELRPSAIVNVVELDTDSETVGANGLTDRSSRNCTPATPPPPFPALPFPA